MHLQFPHSCQLPGEQLRARLKKAQVYTSVWLPLGGELNFPLDLIVISGQSVWLIVIAGLQPLDTKAPVWWSAAFTACPSPLLVLEELKQCLVKDPGTPSGASLRIGVIAPQEVPDDDVYTVASLMRQLAEEDLVPVGAGREWEAHLEKIGTGNSPCKATAWLIEQNRVHYLVQEDTPSPHLRRHRRFQRSAAPAEAVQFAYHRYQAAAMNPHLVPVEVELGEGTVTELWPHEGGLTLQVLLPHLPLTLTEKLEMCSQLAKGLEVCHQHGVVHGNVAPDQVDLNMDVARLTHPWFDFMPFAASGPLPSPPALPSSDALGLGILLRDLLGEETADQKELKELLAGLVHTSPEARWQLSQARASLETMLNLPEPAGWLPTETDDEVLMAGSLVGDYRILRRLGGGSFAQVYEAMHELQDRAYAIKVYHPNIPVADLLGELRLLEDLRHPYIVRVLWCGRLPNDQAYLALEYLEGESLSKAAWGSDVLPLPEILRMMQDILQALVYLHSSDTKRGKLTGKCLFHRDIKPSNIMGVPGRGYVLIDFNVTRESTDQDEFAGTGRYTPPDLVLPGNCWDASGDTYALAVTAYELICGYPPYPDHHVRPGDLPLPGRDRAGDALPPSLEEFLTRAVATRRQDRFNSAVEMLAAVDALTQQSLSSEGCQ